VKACTGVELELVSFLTSVPDGCEWSALQTGLFVAGWKGAGTHSSEAKWAPQPDRMIWRRENCLVHVGDRTTFGLPVRASCSPNWQNSLARLF